ncbi:pyruvate, water dikinase regulatory protein [Latilactobacillus sakei]|uniref:Putative pyruvate, phosphate dikinase regulatory protein n=1 Tax=Latilactobacillus sakei TaxID=1599 RepID=A0AAX0VC00_LATSK|nr:pyruvate, water dikinase regulatory protein [Latilactobacillus sakei]ASN12734.1 phosphoenolpyruvate synthase regulatory protein [Latilactobacillus sakei]PKX72304.1 kinase/pyrophosphorylase [Latilactobacillus sakei]PKX78374.1 kinase/pyrophosphorylase [Latilactobacillus sakei]UNC20492.1 kinase/pyrophosphorylase [Latilactobacillus sakei]UNC22387.1 kinase/pyrophosphorylase [Latilactobacillus sakei]
MSAIPIFIISDSIGETARTVIAAVNAQFPASVTLKIQRFPFITDQKTLTPILQDAHQEQAIIVSTLVNHTLQETVTQFCQAKHLTLIDLLSPLTTAISERSQTASLETPGSLRKLDEHYFHRISAMEFAVRYDDGQDPRGLLEADIVLLGVSRTSKTPLSMYLANQNYRVANLPLIPNVPLPKELFKVPAHKIIGLTMPLSTLLKIRQERLATLGLPQTTNYSNMTTVGDELAYANQIFEQLNATTINVADRSIEETASLIQTLI